MSYEKKFKAAVNVIRSLPKNGAYQPSHDLMLRFYGYYKQATEGPNKMPKPNFWELINKAKWDAWSRLGNMPKEEAMMNYVEELKKIVETMSYTDNVANFLTSLESFYESVPVEDLEMLIGPVIERVQSQPGSPLSGSPLGSREASPQRLKVTVASNPELSPNSSYSASPLPPDTDDEEEDFVDTIEQEEPDRVSRKKLQAVISPHPSEMNPSKISNASHTSIAVIVNGDSSLSEEKKISSHSTKPKEIETSASEKVPLSHNHHVIEDVNTIMRQTAIVLRQDLDSLVARISSLEVKMYKKELEQKQMKKAPVWWPFTDMSKKAIAFLIIWPFIVTLLLQSVQRRKT